MGPDLYLSFSFSIYQQARKVKTSLQSNSTTKTHFVALLATQQNVELWYLIAKRYLRVFINFCTKCVWSNTVINDTYHEITATIHFEQIKCINVFPEAL